MTGRNLHQNKIRTFTPTNKPVIQTNHLPEFTDVDDGLLHRLVVIKFPFKFLDTNDYDETNPKHRKIDMRLKEKLKDCKYDFMHLLIKYYILYKEEGLENNAWNNQQFNSTDFGKRLRRIGFDISRRRINEPQVMAISGYQWNAEFKATIQTENDI